MRLVEVVMLMGAHCVSPVEHSQMMTDAAKVQCAVVIEKDTDKGTLTVTPTEAARDPQVMAAVERFRSAPSDQVATGGTRIVPAWAPAGSPTVEVKRPAGRATVTADSMLPPPPEVTSSAAALQAPAEERAGAPTARTETPSVQPAARQPDKVATRAPAPQKVPPAKAGAAPARKQHAQAADAQDPAKQPGKQSGQCKGTAVAKWYTAADGHKKYRCVKPQPAGDSAPDQLY